jgi:predicted  nucleic acid-binding Zn-ribbon protein
MAISKKKELEKRRAEAAIRDFQGKVDSINGMLSDAASLRARAEDALRKFAAASEKAEESLKDLTRGMSEFDSQSQGAIGKLSTVNNLNVRLSRGILANFSRIKDLKTNAIIVS